MRYSLWFLSIWAWMLTLYFYRTAIIIYWAHFNKSFLFFYPTKRHLIIRWLHLKNFSKITFSSGLKNLLQRSLLVNKMQFQNIKANCIPYSIHCHIPQHHNEMDGRTPWCYSRWYSRCPPRRRIRWLDRKQIKKNPKITAKELALLSQKGLSTIRRRIAKLPHIQYVGSGYSGHWEIKK